MTPTSIPQRFLDETTALPAELPTELLQAPVAGTNHAPGGTFGDQLGPRPDALVFLRHFG